jgi:hypothetical protein
MAAAAVDMAAAAVSEAAAASHTAAAEAVAEAVLAEAVAAVGEAAAAAAGAGAGAAAACHGEVATSARLEHLPITLTDASRHGPGLIRFDLANGVLFAAAHADARQACAWRPSGSRSLSRNATVRKP